MLKCWKCFVDSSSMLIGLSNQLLSLKPNYLNPVYLFKMEFDVEGSDSSTQIDDLDQLLSRLSSHDDLDTEVGYRDRHYLDVTI